jgi:hypothetical protein
MNDMLLSVCLFIAGLCTAATLLMQHPARSLVGAEVAIVDKSAPSTRTEVVMSVNASPKPAVQVPPPPVAQKPQAPTPKDVDVTDSVTPSANNKQGQYVQAESKPLDNSNHKAPAHKLRRYGWEPYPPWPHVYRYPWMDEYRGW